jgi:hypothetical protein
MVSTAPSRAVLTAQYSTAAASWPDRVGSANRHSASASSSNAHLA